MRTTRDRSWHAALRQAGLSQRGQAERDRARRVLWFAIAALTVSGFAFVLLVVLPAVSK